MGRKTLLILSVAVLAAFIVSGCGTSQKKVQSEVSGIKTRVETLESRVESVESKQAEVERTTAEQAQVIDELKSNVAPAPAPKVITNISVKSRKAGRVGKVEDIQQSLKNAGYYDGKIDGVKGKATRAAIREFQKANGLKADGIVGPRTWALLSNYLTAASTGAGQLSSSSQEEYK